MPFCLPKDKVIAFRKALKEREIKIGDLLGMTSEARTTLLRRYAGDSAKEVNLLFEQKLVLKNKLAGLKNFVRQVGELGRFDPKKKVELAKAMEEFKTQQQERLFSPAEEQVFLRDLVEKKFGTSISRAEADAIFKLTAQREKLRGKFFDEKTEKWSDKKAEKETGALQYELELLKSQLKDETLPIKELLRGRFDEFKQLWKEEKLEAAGNLIGDTLKLTRDLTVSIIASIDNSFQLRQGYNVLINKPKVWSKGFTNSWKDLWGTLKGNEAQVKSQLYTDIYSNPNYLKGRYRIADLIPKVEEQFPVSFVGRVPFIGRFFKAAETSFVGSALRMRLGVFDRLLEVQKEMGLDIDNPRIIKDTGRIALQMTARSKLGKTGATLLNHYIFWAPRMVKSAWDTFALPFAKNITPSMRKVAAANMLRFIVSIGVIKAIANTLVPGSITNDPRSTDFKNVRIGNRRFTIGIGELALITLATRLFPTTHNGEWGFWYVNSNGIYKKLEGEFGGRTPFDFAIDFLSNKTVPFPAKLLIDYLKQSTFGGDKPTVLGKAGELITPITIQNILESTDESAVSKIIGTISDFLGGSSNYYDSDENWEQSTSNELIQFKEEIGNDNFEEANNIYNNRLETWLADLLVDQKYISLSDKDKQRVITNKKTALRKEVFAMYDFKPEKTTKAKLPKF